jgi:alkylhydroperoxidase/carboxymuconolactone decarboxylase family protein YurZ
VLLASLIAVDTPRQIRWHLDGAIRNGATVGEVMAVRQMAIDVVEHVGMRERQKVPMI